jgi:uncharacterized membrane protein
MSARAYFIVPLDYVHLSKEEMEAIEYLQVNAGCEDVTLSSFDTGNLLPAFVCLKSFVGHWDQTPSYIQRLTEVGAFYDSNIPDDWRRRLLQDFNIRYVYFGQAERNQGDFDPEPSDYLKLVYQNLEISIYETER